MDFSKVKLVPITIEYLKLKRSWRYEGIYSFYNAPEAAEPAEAAEPVEEQLEPKKPVQCGEEKDMSEEPCCDEEPEYILDGQEYACLDESGQLIGSFNFGATARIPTLEDGSFDEDKLDIGLGMRPDLCGKGYGTDYVRIGIRLAGEIYGRTDLRLSVAAFNERAIKVYERAGFRKVKEVTNAYFMNRFYIMFLDHVDLMQNCT